MNDLITFLRARLDETERLANAATAGPWIVPPARGQIMGGPGGQFVIASQVQAWNHNHITHQNPDFVLAEVDAKRKIIDLASEASGLDMQVDGEFRIGPRDEVTEPYVGDLILRHLATPYADHPSFKEEWRV